MDIGEIFLSSFFQVLVDKLVSLAMDYAQREGVNSTLLNKWKGMLVTINAVLDDAEDKQLRGNNSVKRWLDNVRELGYDMEDLLDEITIKAAQAMSEAESTTSRGQVKRKFSFFGLYKSSKSSPYPRSLVSEDEVQKIDDRLEEIVQRKAFLSLSENIVDRSDYTTKRRPSTSLPEPRLFGREREEKEILELLTGEAENDDVTLSIVPIVGMGGVGKTALAQQLFDDIRAKRCFEKSAWVCVSDVFHVLNITKTILQSITELPCEGKDLNWLQVKLKENLLGNKFLVVLDDVWNEKYGEWIALLKPFEAGVKGSKIILTTRNFSVVSLTGASPYHLKELSLDNCTSLLAFHALGETSFDRHLHLQTIGQKLAEKCKGLPLAVTILGGLLRNKEDLNDWEAILDNHIWNLLTEENGEVLPVLKLSYVHLPSHLKRCFTYCAIFPKDYEIEKDELVLLWIAEGFLDGQKAFENILRLGRSYFDELVSRSFLQRSSINTSKFSMHDLLNDLAKSIAGETCFNSRESKQAGNEHDASSLEKIRYASFISPKYVTSFCRMKALRSLILAYTGSGQFSFYIPNSELRDLFTKLKYLRVFSLCHCHMKKVPNCVGDLKHIRYLNFSYTDIDSLPESIGSLCKLQVLILRGCQNLAELPQGITKLVRLQFLDIRDTGSLKEMPSGFGNLKSLIILPKFVVGPEKGSRLKELKNLPHLQGELFISELQRVEEVTDAVDANLFQKQGLTDLSLHWDENLGNLQNQDSRALVLNSLRPHTNLANLTIWNYGGANFSSWLHGSSYSKLVSLCLRDCPNVMSLPPLGQLPSLKELSLEGLHAVRKISSEFYGGRRPFSSLTTLKFEKMLAWKEWSPYVEGPTEEVSTSCLRYLVIHSCPSLVGILPRQLGCLTMLKIHSCPHLSNSNNEVRLPSLHELHLVDCNNEILKSLIDLPSLTILNINNLIELVCFDRGFASHLVKLKELCVKDCDKLSYLWPDGNEVLNLTCLQSLAIKRCPQLTCFVAGEGEIDLSSKLEIMELRDCARLGKLPSKMYGVKYLSIQNCPKFMGLTIPPYDLSGTTPIYQLESLEINDCDSLTSFPFAKGTLAALKKLVIRGCKGVESLEEITVESLESLVISRCKNVRSLPRCLHMLSHLTDLRICNIPALEVEEFPPLPITLSSFFLENCPKIKSIAIPNNLTELSISDCPALEEMEEYRPLPITLSSFSLQNCSSIAIPTNLTSLHIWECPALEVEEFPPLPITLSSFVLEKCPKIRSLPNKWHHLTSLQEIRIWDCPSIERFPKGGFPPNLQILRITRCQNVKEPLREWGLPFLASLYYLWIDGISMGGGGEGEKVCFPSNDDGDAWCLLFPSSLNYLKIYNMRKVERLSSGLRSHLCSLTSLWIHDCPKLRDLPEDGLPPSLHELCISGCSIMKDRCSKLTGQCWPHIQDIPYIVIDVHRIQ